MKKKTEIFLMLFVFIFLECILINEIVAAESNFMSVIAYVLATVVGIHIFNLFGILKKCKFDEEGK